jgi:hypothetical protein
VVRSLLKSVTGLQARKLQELQIPVYGSEPPNTLELRSSAGFKASLLSLLKGRKGLGGRVRLPGGPADYGGDELEALTAGDVAADSGGGAGDAGEGGSEQGGGSGGGSADYLELMRSAMRVKHKQRKMALLLGSVPPLPLGAAHHTAAPVVVQAPQMHTQQMQAASVAG